MPDAKPPITPTSTLSPAAQLLTATHAETREIHGDTRRIIDLLEESGTGDAPDRIDQILEALAEVLTSLATLHGKVDRLGTGTRKA